MVRKLEHIVCASVVTANDLDDTSTSKRSGQIVKLEEWRARESEPIMGIWERSLQRGPEAELLVRGPVELVGFCARQHLC